MLPHQEKMSHILVSDLKFLTTSTLCNFHLTKQYVDELYGNVNVEISWYHGEWASYCQYIDAVQPMTF